MSNLRLIAGRELMEAFRARSYWVTIAIFMLIVAASIVVPRFFDGETTWEVGLAGDIPTGIEQDLEVLGGAFDANVEITSFADLDAATLAVEEEEVSVALVVEGGEQTLVRRDQTSATVVGVVNQVAAAATARDLLIGEGLDGPTISAALAPATPTEVVVDDDVAGRAGIAWATGLVLYLAIFMGGMSVAQAVATEKSARIAEVLVSTVRPSHLLAGKVLGIGISTLIIVLAGAVPFAGAIAAGWVDVPSAAAADVIAAVGWFILGYMIYAVGFGALGALVDRQEDLGTAVGPLSAVLVLSYLATIQAATDPNSTLSIVVSIIPFSAPMVMPVRIGADAASLIEVAAAVGLSILTIFVLARFGGAIYRRALLRGGQRLKVTQLLRG